MAEKLFWGIIDHLGKLLTGLLKGQTSPISSVFDADLPS
jgi:hypothetical protein